MDATALDTVSRIVTQQVEDLERKRTRLSAERDAIDDELTKIEHDLSDLEVFVRVYQRFADQPVARPRASEPGPVARPRRPAMQDGPDGPATNGTTNTLGRLEGITVAEAAERALRFLGGEAESGELRDLLINRGALRPDHNSYGYLLKQMGNKPDRFVKIARGRWGLREKSNQ